MRAHQTKKTRSSTKAELVVVDGSMSQIVWTRYFLEEEVYGINNKKFIETTIVLCC